MVEKCLLKKFGVFCLFFVALTLSLLGQEAQSGAAVLTGQDAPADFKWTPANENQASYGLLSLDGKDRQFYVDTGTFFAPVKASASRDLYTRYTSKPVKELKFYDRKQDGKTVYFNEVFSVNVEDLRDFIVLIFANEEGKILAKAVDISLKKMPLASLSVVNVSPYKLGLAADKSFAKLDPFESYSKKFSGDADEIKVCTLRMYDLKNPKAPKLLLTKSYSFWTTKRIVVFFFELPRMENASERPASLVMYDRGPR
mgnify:CR=1 FL=1